MTPGMRYIVTKAIDDGTFQVGDHISPNENGTISCIEAQGWVEKSDVQEAIKGMEYEPDRAWAKRQIEKAERIAKQYA